MMNNVRIKRKQVKAQTTDNQFGESCPSSTMLKSQTQNQLATHGKSARAHILICEVMTNQCGTMTIPNRFEVLSCKQEKIDTKIANLIATSITRSSYLLAISVLFLTKS